MQKSNTYRCDDMEKCDLGISAKTLELLETILSNYS